MPAVGLSGVGPPHTEFPDGSDGTALSGVTEPTAIRGRERSAGMTSGGGCGVVSADGAAAAAAAAVAAGVGVGVSFGAGGEATACVRLVSGRPTCVSSGAGRVT